MIRAAPFVALICAGAVPVLSHAQQADPVPQIKACMQQTDEAFDQQLQEVAASDTLWSQPPSKWDFDTDSWDEFVCAKSVVTACMDGVDSDPATPDIDLNLLHNPGTDAALACLANVRSFAEQVTATALEGLPSDPQFGRGYADSFGSRLSSLKETQPDQGCRLMQIPGKTGTLMREFCETDDLVKRMTEARELRHQYLLGQAALKR